MEAVDFSGGEPTVHPDFLELVGYAASKGFDSVCMLSNGILLSDKELARNAVRAGLNDVLFSLHGHDRKTHERATRSPGSFDKILRAIGNIRESGTSFRINCTVSRLNYESLRMHARLYRDLSPGQINFILFNDFESAHEVAHDYAVRYSEAAPHIKEAVAILRESVPYVNIRYVPFCFFEGFEKHITNYPQKIFDPFEWSQRLLLRLPASGIASPWRYWGSLAYGLLRFRPRFRLERAYLEDICVRMCLGKYVKPASCRACRFHKICQGLEKSYVRLFDVKELRPVRGEKITDPLHFRQDFYGRMGDGVERLHRRSGL